MHQLSRKKNWNIKSHVIILLLSLLALQTGFNFHNIKNAPSLYIKISINREVFKITDPIGIAITVFGGSQNSKVTFHSAQIYDLILVKENQVIWQWSNGRMFTQNIITKEIKVNEPLLFCEVLDPSKLNLGPGTYKLIPRLCLEGIQEGEPIIFKIRQD